MIEDIVTTRYRATERANGRIATWWHYNRMTLVILLSAILALAWLLHIEREHRREAQSDAAILAAGPSFLCYTQERSTSIIIAGGSQKQVDDALRAAGYQIDQVRGAFIAARDRQQGNTPYRGTLTVASQ